MEKIRIMIVDDSRVSCAMLTDILNKTNFIVCGTARNAAEAVERYQELKPAAVTMDMNLPDADGVECSRRIREIDQDAKIVMISAMKDASLIMKGRAVGISSFLQKPVSANELIDTLMVLCHDRAGTIAVLRESYVKSFVKVLQKSLFSLVGVHSKVELEVDESGFLEVDGVAVIIGLTGYPMGRAIVYMNRETMMKFSSVLLDKEEVALTESEGGDTVEEAANIIVGRGVSKINDIFKDKEMRITPPGTICGERIRIANSKLTSFRITAVTRLGNICMNLGFAEGE